MELDDKIPLIKLNYPLKATHFDIRKSNRKPL